MTKEQAIRGVLVNTLWIAAIVALTIILFSCNKDQTKSNTYDLQGSWNLDTVYHSTPSLSDQDTITPNTPVSFVIDAVNWGDGFNQNYIQKDSLMWFYNTQPEDPTSYHIETKHTITMVSANKAYLDADNKAHKVRLVITK